LELYQQKKTPSPTCQSQRFNEEDALYSCHGEDTTKRKKNILLGMTASAGLSPVAIIDDEGREENLLAHDVVASKICDNKRRTVTIKRTGGSKSFYDGSYKNGLCCPLSLSKQNNQPGLSPILSSCPFKKILHTRTFIELNDDMCKKLNDDWELYPQLKFFYARALTGSIIVNNNDNTAALINMVEVYGRNKSVDAHHERYMDNSKTGIQVSTLPPVVTKYKNFWATTTIQDNSVKLHFASKTFNALVTSSYRMDGKHEAEVGLSTTSFRLDNMSTFRNSATSQIYIDLASWNKALTVLKEKKKWHDICTVLLSGGAILSKKAWMCTTQTIYNLTTYAMCRAASVFVDDHSSHSITIFTYCDKDDNQKIFSDGIIVSSLFKSIALKVIRDKEEATIIKEEIEDLISRAKDEKKVEGILTNILYLFEIETITIKVISNYKLNQYLKELADIMNSYLNNSSKIIAKSITEKLKFMQQFKALSFLLFFYTYY
ncbi:hypothetical protein EDC94DRAFT_674112, partial [Helicostylum pulchrum]